MTPGARRRRRPGNDEHRVGCARMAADRDERALVIVGGGRMGEALLAGILAAGRPADELAVAEVSPPRGEELAAAHAGVEVTEAPVPAAGAVLAVKPADAAAAAAAVADAGAQRILSVAAGVTTEAIERATGGRVPVIRAMPNTPALVGAGAAAICAGAAAGGGGRGGGGGGGGGRGGGGGGVGGRGRGGRARAREGPRRGHRPLRVRAG